MSTTAERLLELASELWDIREKIVKDRKRFNPVLNEEMFYELSFSEKGEAICG